MKTPKIDTSAQERIAAAQAASNQAIAAAQQAATNLQQNMQADLTQQNMATVVAGGSADAAASVGNQSKRKRVAQGIASSLGIRL